MSPIFSRALIPALIANFVFGYTDSLAETALKRAVLENCNLAKRELATLPSGEVDEFLSYLVLVLKRPPAPLDLPAPGSGVLQPGLKLSPIADPKLKELVSAFEPSKEVEAKKCALELLTELAPNSLKVIADMVSVARDEKIMAMDPDIAELLHEATLEITVRSKREKPELATPEIFSGLAQALEGGSLPFARTVFVEFEPLGIPSILKAFLSSSIEIRNGAAQLLEEAGNYGALSGIDSAELRPALIKAFSASAEVEQGTIDLILASLDSGDRNLEQDLLRLLKGDSEDLRAKTLLVLGRRGSGSNEVFSQLLGHLSDSNFRVKLAALRALGFFESRRQERKSAILKALKEGANYSSAQRRILLYATASTLLMLYPKEDFAAFIPQLIEALEAPIPTNEELKSFKLPELGFRTEELTLAVERALAAIGDKIVPALIKGIEKGALGVRAVTTLGAVTPPSAEVVKALVGLLRNGDPQIALRATEVLTSIGPRALSELRKGLKWPAAENRIQVARIINQITPRDRSVLSEFETLAASERCEDRIEALRVLLTLEPAKGSKLLENCYECLATVTEPTRKAVEVRKIVELSPNDPRAVTPLKELLNLRDSSALRIALDAAAILNRSISADLIPALESIYDREKSKNSNAYRALVEIVRRDSTKFDLPKILVGTLKNDQYNLSKEVLLNLDSDLVVSILNKALETGDREQKLRALDILSELGRRVSEASPQVISLLTDLDWVVRQRAAVTLVKIAPNLDEAKSALRHELTGRHVDLLLSDRFTADIIPLINELIQESRSEIERRNALELLRSVDRVESI